MILRLSWFMPGDAAVGTDLPSLAPRFRGVSRSGFREPWKALNARGRVPNAAQNWARRDMPRGAHMLALSCSELWIAAMLLGTLAALAQEKITYQDHVLPLIENNCGKCHNPDKKKADLDLTTYSGVMKGSGSGQVVVSGNLDGSKLWRAITQVEEPTMPPHKPPLPAKELDMFRKWIMGGLLETSGSKAIAANK